MSVIHHLAQTRLTPEVVLHRTLADLSDVKSVVVLIQRADGSWEADYSQLSHAELCMAEKWLSLEVADVVMGISND